MPANIAKRRRLPMQFCIGSTTTALMPRHAPICWRFGRRRLNPAPVAGPPTAFSESLRASSLARPDRLFFFVLRQRCLANDLLLHVARHDVVVAELHRVAPLPLRDRAELGGVARHFGERGDRL